MVLLRIDIGAFQKNRLSQEALDYITRILTFFQSREKGIILRIAYDTQGQGLLREPESSALIKIHMRQLGEVLLPFAQDILVFQGILVGSWGEMHNSRFLSERWLRELAQTMLEALQYQCTLAVRKPSQWRAIVRDSPKILQERLALFNDGIFGSETDLGTYGTVSRAQVWETDSWLREEELEWQQITLQKQTNGGEMPGTAPWEKAAADFAKMHLCYLNSTYSPEALEIWKNTKVFWKACKEELSAYDYIGRHLGYRFVVQKLQWKNERLYITVENCGFANPVPGKRSAGCFSYLPALDSAFSIQKQSPWTGTVKAVPPSLSPCLQKKEKRAPAASCSFSAKAMAEIFFSPMRTVKTGFYWGSLERSAEAKQ